MEAATGGTEGGQGMSDIILTLILAFTIGIAVGYLIGIYCMTWRLSRHCDQGGFTLRGKDYWVTGTTLTLWHDDDEVMQEDDGSKP